MKIETDNTFAVSTNHDTVAIENIHPRHMPRMTQESAANLAAHLFAFSGATQAEFLAAVAAIQAGLPAPHPGMVSE